MFANKLRMIRGWEITRCRMEWEKIKCDPSLDSDMKGPAWSKERCEIPAWLVGEEANVQKDVEFEEHRLDTATKWRQMKQEELAQARQDLMRGFEDKGQNNVNKFLEEQHLSVSAGSLLSEPSPHKELKDIMLSALGRAGPLVPDPSSVSLASASAAQALSPETQTPKKPAPTSMANFLSQRILTKKQTATQTDKMKHKVMTTICDARAFLDEAK